MSRPGAIAEFDLCGPLPSGVTLLEASAGTGKTYAIAALVARFVADGVPPEQLLAVTFTRMATGELRERVRERLVSAELGLAGALAGVEPPADDPVLELLADGAGTEVAARRQRLAAAVAGFDAATIATTHGFCQHVLAGLGVRGDVERDATFVEDVSDLVAEVVDDLYVRRFHGDMASPAFGRADALQIGTAAVRSPHALLEPLERQPGDEDTTWAMRRRLAEAVRKEVDKRKRRSGVITYDDLLTRLRDTLADPDHGAAACARLRELYRVALVDEFQDTDPIQWEILQRAFADENVTLILIGDPKQAVYSFRGADVYAYLNAARSAVEQRTLATNWRSDKALIDALDALFDGAQLGHEGIVHRRVRAAPANREPRLVDAPAAGALRIRVLHRGDGLVRLTPSGYASKPGAEAAVADDLAADLVRLLSSSAVLVRRAPDGSERREPVRPRHVAVLVRTHKLAALVDDALERVGVPAVINGAGSVFATPAGGEWLRLLEALERPHSGSRARAAALTAFLGWSAATIAAADHLAEEELHGKLHRWARLLRSRGVAGLIDSIWATEAVPRRTLARVGGERRLTDLGHVGQLLHTATIEQQLGVSSLTAWLRQRIADADGEGADEDRALRLDSDAEAVQVLTIHRSKGLEFPVVYHPFLWQPAYIDEKEPPAYHDDGNDDAWTIDVGGEHSPEFDRHGGLRLGEQRGEDLRLLYVALTRTMHQATVWWAGAWESRHSALGRLLFAREVDGAVSSAGSYVPADDDVVARFEQLAAAAPGTVTVERVEAPTGARWAGEPRPPVELEAGRFERALDARWRRVSYSGIVAGGREQAVATEPEVNVVEDELLPTAPAADATEESDAEEQRLRATPAALSAMPGGAEVGDLLHRVLEATDFASPELEAELARRLTEQQGRRHVDIGDAEAVLAGLAAAIETPLGPLVGELRLRDAALVDRLDELVFELPLVGGDAPAGTLALDDLAALLEAHLPADDPLAGYAARLRDPLLGWNLRGYLTGTLDLVLRIRAEGGPPRFALVDYKSNWLGADGEALSAWHYRPAAIAEAMQRAHYPLQALLYLAALHRYLRARLSDYDAGTHLAGVLYLFLRGLIGPATPRVGGHPCGVFAWRPPARLVEELSDLLDRGRAVP
jgi:exodeoxyribonuclease V beta subunit